MPRPRTNETTAERKARERMEFLALPPAEAQRLISFTRHAPLRHLPTPSSSFRSSLLPPLEDETVDS